MTKLLPVSFLAAFASLFGISWIVTGTNPDNVRWYIFGLFVLLVFCFLFNILGLVIYFLRVRFQKRLNTSEYFYSSYKIAFFISILAVLIAILAILKLTSSLNIFLAIFAVFLFALWNYLGKKVKE